jgi:hypothetical protein
VLQALGDFRDWSKKAREERRCEDLSVATPTITLPEVPGHLTASGINFFEDGGSHVVQPWDRDNSCHADTLERELSEDLVGYMSLTTNGPTTSLISVIMYPTG